MNTNTVDGLDVFFVLAGLALFVSALGLAFFSGE